MSYGCDFSFKRLEPAEIFPFLVDFKHACTKHLKEIADEQFWCCPFNVEHHPLPEPFTEITIEERRIAQYWAHNNIFKFKYFYNPELKLLGMSGVYEPLLHLFDKTVHFQDSTDQDYERSFWEGIPEFEAIYVKWMTMPWSEFDKEYAKRKGESFDDFIEREHPEYEHNEMKIAKKMEYYCRSFCYEEIWSHFSQHLWHDEDQIFFSVYGNSERQEIMKFIKYCYDAQIETQKKGGW